MVGILEFEYAARMGSCFFLQLTFQFQISFWDQFCDSNCIRKEEESNLFAKFHVCDLTARLVLVKLIKKIKGHKKFFAFQKRLTTYLINSPRKIKLLVTTLICIHLEEHYFNYYRD